MCLLSVLASEGEYCLCSPGRRCRGERQLFEILLCVRCSLHPSFFLHSPSRREDYYLYHRGKGLLRKIQDACLSPWAWHEAENADLLWIPRVSSLAIWDMCVTCLGLPHTQRQSGRTERLSWSLHPSSLCSPKSHPEKELSRFSGLTLISAGFLFLANLNCPGGSLLTVSQGTREVNKWFINSIHENVPSNEGGAKTPLWCDFLPALPPITLLLLPFLTARSWR